jgi:hypothetical protein
MSKVSLRFIYQFKHSFNLDHHESKEKIKQSTRTVDRPFPPLIAVVNEKDKHLSPTRISPVSNAPTTLTNKLETVANANKEAFTPIMSSADAFLVSSTRIALETEQRKTTKRRDLFTKIEKTLQQQTDELNDPLCTSLSVDPNSFLDVDSYIPLPDRPGCLRSGPIKSRIDLEIRQSTVKQYERYASASTRTTAINCLQEAGYFKKKSWLKQVEISKEMIKHKVQQRIHRADNQMNRKPTLLPLRATVPTSSHKTNTAKVN